MRFAYLIMAHHNFSQLQLLLDLLDDERNDIYVHIDKKIKTPVFLHTVRSKLYQINNRIDVAWGDVSVIQAEYSLFRAAYKNGPYDYYHLLSGDDLPIKSNDYIDNFFAQNNGKEFVGYGKDVPERCTRYHLFTRHYKHKWRAVSIMLKLTRIILEPIVNLIPKKLPAGIEFKKGCNWVSITNNCCRYILEKEEEVVRFFRNTYCCDEVFVQTLVWNSPFKEAIYNSKDIFHGCMRLIDWTRGGPYVWGGESSDIHMIIESDRLFARKFDMTVHPDIVKALCEHLKKDS